jgi:nitrite reductase (NADH) small subunit
MDGTEYHLTNAEFEASIQHLDVLIQEFDALPYPQVREKAFDLLQAIDTIHRESLGRLITFLRTHGQSNLVERAAADPAIHTLLLLYDLVPADERTQAERGLREGFPAFKGIAVHEAEAETVGLTSAPGIDIIPLELVNQASRRQPRRPIFQAVAPLEDVPPGTMKAFDIVGGRVLIANVDGEVYAVRNTCPSSMAPLELGSFAPPIVVCPWHNDAYDIRTGKRADGGHAGAGIEQKLAVLPVAVVDGTIQVAVNTAPDAAVR